MEAGHPLIEHHDSQSNSSIELELADRSPDVDLEDLARRNGPFDDDEKYLAGFSARHCLSNRMRPVWGICRLYLILLVAFLLIVGLGLVVTSNNNTNDDHDNHHHDHEPDNHPEGHTQNSTLTTIWPPAAKLSNQGLPIECGTSNAEAKARGCIFDVMIYCWIPPACYESDLAADVQSETSRFAPFHMAGVFNWYADSEGQKAVSQDADALSEMPEIWATHDWHQAHCLYFWRLLARGVNRNQQNRQDGAYVLSQAIVFPHTLHCNDMLADQKKDGNDLIRTLRIYGTCAKLDGEPNPYLEHGSFPVDPE